MGRFWHGILLLVTVWSAIAPADYLTWLLDMAPALLVYAGLVATRRALPLTPLACWLLFLLLIIILVGAHYGFGQVPMFTWSEDLGGGFRNDFDKFAHFFQGFVPVIAIRELLIRCNIVPSAGWRNAVGVALTLALSALYELVEWTAHVLFEERAEMFIASQGDPWDAQSDMAMALLGAIAALGMFSRLHDVQLAAWKEAGNAVNTR